MTYSKISNSVSKITTGKDTNDFTQPKRKSYRYLKKSVPLQAQNTCGFVSFLTDKIPVTLSWLILNHWINVNKEYVSEVNKQVLNKVK